MVEMCSVWGAANVNVSVYSVYRCIWNLLSIVYRLKMQNMVTAVKSLHFGQNFVQFHLMFRSLSLSGFSDDLAMFCSLWIWACSICLLLTLFSFHMQSIKIVYNTVNKSTTNRYDKINIIILTKIGRNWHTLNAHNIQQKMLYIYL